MKKKIIIMTTAIIRPNLHNTSIGNFYKNYISESKFKDDIINNFDIYHIINIDSPEKLKPYFTAQETIDNFNKIIPDNVNKIYIPTEKPNFLSAFKNIMHKINELNLLSPDNYYWWFEDDWSVKQIDFNFFDQIVNILIFYNCNMTLVYNTPLGSFRGGPIMNGYYFINHFNIENLGIMNNTCDPEKQVSKYLTCNKGIISADKSIIVREIKNDMDRYINLVLVYNDCDFNKIDDNFIGFFYERNFNKEIMLNYYIILINNYDYNDINYLNLKYDKHQDINNYIKNKDNYNKSSFELFKNNIDNHSITYFMIRPFIIEDCGRKYAKQYNLVKAWKNPGDEITYQ